VKLERFYKAMSREAVDKAGQKHGFFCFVLSAENQLFSKPIQPAVKPNRFISDLTTRNAGGFLYQSIISECSLGYHGELNDR